MHQPPISELFDNPGYYLFDFDGDAALFVRMDRNCYAKSIFFDERIVTIDDDAVRVPITALDDFITGRDLPALRLGWIFHMAHTGSTLLARALDRRGNSLVIREPASLRSLGVEAGARPFDHLMHGDWDARLRVSLAMLDRRFAVNETVLIKGNVPVNAIIGNLLSASNDSWAILLHFGLDDYLVAILRSANHRGWVEHIFAEMRLHESSEALDIAEKAAALWLYQIRVFDTVLAEYPETRSLDANILFDRPELCLICAAHYFGIDMTEKDVRQIVSSDLFSTYSKNPNARFDNEVRRARQAENRAALQSELRIARRWVDNRISVLPLPERLSQPLCGENGLLL